MNITRLNFASTLPYIQQIITRSHFLALDLEMSGILTQQSTSPYLLDSMQKRYQKQKQSITKFIPLQFGLSAFQIIAQSNKQIYQNKIIAYPFNFYIFPLTHQHQAMKFSFHAGTMNFLTKNNFDFNTLFYEGIRYTSKQSLKESKTNQQLSQYKQQMKRLKRIQSPQTKAFIKINMPIIEAWIQSSNNVLQIDIKFIKFQAYIMLKQQIQQTYPNRQLLFSYDKQQIFGRSIMIITKTNLQKVKRQQKVNEDEENDKLFNEVVDLLISSKKPLIVHNGYLDLMHIYYRFISNLPQTWVEYKNNIHSMFPTIYDNKYLFSNSPILYHNTNSRSTGLEDCFTGIKKLHQQQTLKAQTFSFQIAQQFKKYDLDNLQCHEAGFDSLMTGFSFLKGIAHLNNNDLNLLIGQKTFNKENRLYINRVPLGNIKVPINFEQNDEDMYIRDGNMPFYFKSIFHQIINEDKAHQYFNNNYGPIKMMWSSRDMSEFCIIFLNEEHQKLFQQQLQSKFKVGNIASIMIGQIQLLVFTSSQSHKIMKNYIYNEEKAASADD